MKKKSIAIIGGGASGTVAAWLLRDIHQVTLFEANDYLGGHVYTCHVNTKDHENIPVDMGVEYFNEKVSPNVFNLLRELEIDSYVAPSSFHASYPECSLNWSNINLDGPLHQTMLNEFSRFQLGMFEVMSSGENSYKAMSIGDYLEQKGYTQQFIDFALFPIVSIITGCNADLRCYPLMFFALTFNANLVSFFSSGYWRKVHGGMGRYLQTIAGMLGERVKLKTPIERVIPDGKRVAVFYAGKKEIFDEVIFATSAEIAFSLLDASLDKQREILSKFSYYEIESVVHQDVQYLCDDTASHYFNFKSFSESMQGITACSVTRLVNALSPFRDINSPLMVTLDPRAKIDSDIASRRWRVSKNKPCDFNFKTQLAEVQGSSNIWFCGVDTSLGGHEGAVVSGMVIAERLGAKYPYKNDMPAYIQFKVTKDIMGVKTCFETVVDTMVNLLFVFAKKCSLHKSLSYKFIKDIIV